jgi:selenocysteine-specific translation elongation factor
VRPDRKIPADSAAWRAQLEEQRQRVLEQLQSDRIRLILGSLRRNADVQDLRAELERAQREAERQSIPTSPLGF